MKEEVILVDKNDREIGIEEKIKAHENGKLHRAFSIFVFNSKGEILLQKRAGKKYHCSGLWTNTCCGHPRPAESLEKAAYRRLKEEMGFDCPLKEIGSFTYKAKLDNGLSECEIDHVFIGTFNGEPKPEPNEVDEWKWTNIKELEKDVGRRPNKYTPWFKIAIKRSFYRPRKRGI